MRFSIVTAIVTLAQLTHLVHAQAYRRTPPYHQYKKPPQFQPPHQSHSNPLSPRKSPHTPHQPPHSYARRPTPAKPNTPLGYPPLKAPAHPAPYRPSQPKEKVSCKPPCCLDARFNFQAQHIPNIDDHYDLPPGYKPVLKKKLIPEYNVVLFPEDCPHIMDEKAICEAVSKLFGKPSTTLSPQYSKASGKIFHRRLEAGYRARRLSSAAIDRQLAKRELLSDYERENTITYHSQTKSADVVVVGMGCCYNVFPSVTSGDKLTTDCSNDLFGPVEADNGSPGLVELFYNAMVGAGKSKLGNGSVTGTAMSSVIFAKDWTGEDQYAITGSALGGVFSNIALSNGGTINDMLHPIDVTGIADLENINTRVDPSGGFMEISAAEVKAIQDRNVVQICALSNQMKQLEENGQPPLPNSVDTAILDLSCEGVTTDICVIEVDSKTLSDPQYSLGVDIVTSRHVGPIYINVVDDDKSHPAQQFPGPLTVDMVINGDSPSNEIVFNFVNAKSADIGVDDTVPGQNWPVGFVFPQAAQVNIGVSTETVLMGKRGSLLVHMGAVVRALTPGIPLLPEPGVVVTTCNCLCEKGRDCKIEVESPRHKGHQAY